MVLLLLSWAGLPYTSTCMCSSHTLMADQGARLGVYKCKLYMHVHLSSVFTWWIWWWGNFRNNVDSMNFWLWGHVCWNGQPTATTCTVMYFDVHYIVMLSLYFWITHKHGVIKPTNHAEQRYIISSQAFSSSNPQQKSRVRCVIDPDMNYICYILFQGDFHFLVPTSYANDFAPRQTRQRFLWKFCHILLDVNIAVRGIMIGLIKLINAWINIRTIWVGACYMHMSAYMCKLLDLETGWSCQNICGDVIYIIQPYFCMYISQTYIYEELPPLLLFLRL